MKFCSSCGEQMADDALFCSKCGAKVDGIDTNVPISTPEDGQYGGYNSGSVEKSFFEKYLSFDALFSFTGRLNRKSYIIIGLLLCFLGGLIGTVVGALFGEVMAGIFSLILMIPGFAITARRLHDINLSGWYICAAWVIIILGIIMNSETIIGLGFLVSAGLSLALFFIKGTTGTNKYGNDPLQ